MSDSIGVMSLSVYQLLNDKDFIEALEIYNWSTKPESKTSGQWFYNQFSNAALVIDQKSSTVEISAINLMEVQSSQLPPGSRQISALIDARSFAVFLLQEYANFNVFENSNSMDDIFGSNEEDEE